MAVIEDTGLSISVAILILGVALGLPHISFGELGLDFGAMPATVIAILRLGLIGLALSVGLKPIEKDRRRGGN